LLPLPLLPSLQHSHDIWIYIILDEIIQVGICQQITCSVSREG